MNSVSPSLSIRKRKLPAFRGRGEIYSWLRVHSREIAPKLEQGSYTWPALCAEMVRHGVAGRGGEPPKPNAAMRVWHRVLKDVGDVGVVERSRSWGYPSRLPKDWRPPSVPGPSDALVVAPVASTGKYDPAKSRALMRKIINERSGRKE